MSSIAGLRGSPGLAAYCATKGGVRLFAKSVALECARPATTSASTRSIPASSTRRSGARSRRRRKQSRANAPIDPHERAAVIVPMGVVGTAQDIANGVLFLCSDASSHMTASELVIDGGMTGGAVRGGP